MIRAAKNMTSGFTSPRAAEQQTTSAGYAKAVMDFAVANGADLQQLVQQSGISPDDLLDKDRRIPFLQVIALMRAGKELCRDPAFALHFGAASQFDEISIVGLIWVASETIADAFAQLNRYARLVIDNGEEAGDRFALVRRDDGAWLEFRGRNPLEFPEIIESGAARFAGYGARFLPNAPPLIKLARFMHAEPAYAEECARVLKAPVFFGCERNEIKIDQSWLASRGPNPDRYVFGIFSERAEALMKSLENAKTVRGQVEAALIPMLHKGEPAMEDVARRLGVSRTTLYRKLKAEEASFERLLDDLRLKMALHYLAGEKATVNETAYLVGFSDPAAFSRAFKRWTGKSPKAARNAGA